MPSRSAASVSRPRVAATSAQREILVAALDHYATRGDWPTAQDLAIGADCTFPDACRELKILGRLGLVSWGKTVRVLRQPDGLFFLPRNTERAFSSVLSRDCTTAADCSEVAS